MKAGNGIAENHYVFLLRAWRKQYSIGLVARALVLGLVTLVGALLGGLAPNQRFTEAAELHSGSEVCNLPAPRHAVDGSSSIQANFSLEVDTPTPLPTCGSGSNYIVTTSVATIVPGTNRVANSQCDECTQTVN